ncbi:MAG: acetolactate synthase small subunit [Bacillota bacterium]|nr:acetolactate synthase small subunit [Bacillota bacterium]
MDNNSYCVIEITVKNHPGVMSHITGLFARRAFNLEGILCGKIGDSEDSRIYLLVDNDERLDQIIKQLQKLYDVMEVLICKTCKPSVFSQISEIVKNSDCEI